MSTFWFPGERTRAGTTPVMIDREKGIALQSAQPVEAALESSEDPEKSERAGESGMRLPYEAPRILYRQPIEAIAAACGGTDPKTGTFDCPFATTPNS